jgi:hypothetical protein
MLLEDYLRCSGGLAKQATGRKLVVCALCTHRPGGASATGGGILATTPFSHLNSNASLMLNSGVPPVVKPFA